MASACLTRPELTRHIRRQLSALLCDDSRMAPEGIAVYWLSDPRDVHEIRYVGQTRAPRRRFLQHLSTARLWLPDERPWWVPSPKLRPLYEWIRDLHRDEYRLPVMVVSTWLQTPAQARVAERARILECLEQRLPLLNFESEVLGRQIPLL
jgi:hypothetical protein